MLEAGRLNRRVTILRPPTAANSLGEVELDDISTWVEVATVWAEVKPQTAGEAKVGEQQRHATTHTVTIRYTANIVAATYRLRFGTRIFEVQSVINVGEENIELRLTCSESPSASPGGV